MRITGGNHGEELTVRKRIDLGILARVSVYTTETGEGILTVDIHRAGTTDTLSA